MSSERWAVADGSKTRKKVTLRSEYLPPSSTIWSWDGLPISADLLCCSMAPRITSESGRGVERRNSPNMGGHLPGAPWCERLPASSACAINRMRTAVRWRLPDPPHPRTADGAEGRRAAHRSLSALTIPACRHIDNVVLPYCEHLANIPRS